MAEKMYFGIPGLIQEIKAPDTGMGFDSETDVEVTNLVSGGRSAWRASTAYKAFNMSWKSNSAGLEHLINLYNGQFGPGPFYLTDPTISQKNILPARWSFAWQLAFQSNGWCRPVVKNIAVPTVLASTTPLTNRSVLFTQLSAGAGVLTQDVVRTRHIVVPNKAYYLAAKGTATGGAGIKILGYSTNTQSWQTISTFTTFTGVSSMVLAANSVYSMIELNIYMPLGSTLELSGLALGTETPSPDKWMPEGHGVGAVQFSGALGGTLVSTAIDRIGLSLDFIEVQNVESAVL